jgi:hypothetical protein
VETPADTKHTNTHALTHAPRCLAGADFVLQYSRVLHLGLGLEDSWGFTLRQISNASYCIGVCVCVGE